MAELKKEEEKNTIDVLNMDLPEEAEKALRETLQSWKEEVYDTLMEEVEEAKEQKITELDEKNVEFRESLKEEYAGKMLNALKEMREELRAEVLAEVYDNNPELKVLEEIKALVAPTINEDYLGNVYANELQTLRERVMELEEENMIEEGAKKLAELISPYSKKTQNIILSIIKEGGPDEVTEQFHSLMEKLGTIDEEDSEDDEDEDDEDIKASADPEEESDEEDEDEDEEDDEDVEESTEEDKLETYIKEDEEGKDHKKEKQKINPLKDRIKSLIS